MARRGNRDWSNGKAAEVRPAMPTEFEGMVQMLKLSESGYESSQQLHEWCKVHRNHKYVPEWLLTVWDLPVKSESVVL